MRRIRFRIQNKRVVEPAELPEVAEGWLRIPEGDQEDELMLDSPADLPTTFNPEQARRALEESIGALRGIDRDAFLRDLCSARSQKQRHFLK